MWVLRSSSAAAAAAVVAGASAAGDLDWRALLWHALNATGAMFRVRRSHLLLLPVYACSRSILGVAALHLGLASVLPMTLGLCWCLGVVAVWVGTLGAITLILAFVYEVVARLPPRNTHVGARLINI